MFNLIFIFDVCFVEAVLRTVHHAVNEDYAEFERMRHSDDPVEKALGTFYLALVPSFGQALADLHETVPANHVVAASMQALAQVVAGLMIAAHGEGPRQLYTVWQPAFERLVLKNIALFESGQDGELPAAMRFWDECRLVQ